MQGLPVGRGLRGAVGAAAAAAVPGVTPAAAAAARGRPARRGNVTDGAVVAVHAADGAGVAVRVVEEVDVGGGRGVLRVVQQRGPGARARPAPSPAVQRRQLAAAELPGVVARRRVAGGVRPPDRAAPGWGVDSLAAPAAVVGRAGAAVVRAAAVAAARPVELVRPGSGRHQPVRLHQLVERPLRLLHRHDHLKPQQRSDLTSNCDLFAFRVKF